MCRRRVGGGDAVAVVMDSTIMAFDDLLWEYVGRVSAVAEKIVGQVLDVTKVVAYVEDSVM